LAAVRWGWLGKVAQTETSSKKLKLNPLAKIKTKILDSGAPGVLLFFCLSHQTQHPTDGQQVIPTFPKICLVNITECLLCGCTEYLLCGCTECLLCCYVDVPNVYYVDEAPPERKTMDRKKPSCERVNDVGLFHLPWFP
jgi:hypothetical protein